MATKLTARNLAQTGERHADSRRDRRDETPSVSGAELLELLGDEYTRRVLQAVVSEPMSGSQVVEEASVSKATAYRRLETLQEAGLVESTTVFDPDGHHHDQFHAVVDGMTVELEGSGVSTSLHRERHAADD